MKLRLLRSAVAGLTLLLLVSLPPRLRAAGVTLITHGFELQSGFQQWLATMADGITAYPRFPGTNFTTYLLSITYNNGYNYSVTREEGVAPEYSDSGEIMIELDWSSLSGDLFDDYANTYNVATAVSAVLMSTNAIPEMNGHALVELPLHLIGHSRGGSLVSEIAHQLGTNGIWVDHLTTLDPYPINNDGNDDFPATIEDAPAAQTYENVLFADNYWQDLGAGAFLGDPDGEPVAGAYVRKLENLSGGYDSDHSNVHLWYFGTVVTNTPVSDSSASITAAERSAWWTPYEEDGAVAGFLYSILGGGDRLSTNQPQGAGFSAIRDGFNQHWDLGAGNTNNNRAVLSSNRGAWPNVIELDRTDTNVLFSTGILSIASVYQWAGTNSGSLGIYLDEDLNPFGTNQILLSQVAVAGTTNGETLGRITVPVTLQSANVLPGWYYVLASVTGGGRTRYVYSQAMVQVVPSQAPTLGISTASPGVVAVTENGASGEMVILQSSLDLRNWISVATNSIGVGSNAVVNLESTTNVSAFYRAVVVP
jgi:hypothetical protein